MPYRTSLRFCHFPKHTSENVGPCALGIHRARVYADVGGSKAAYSASQQEVLTRVVGQVSFIFYGKPTILLQLNLCRTRNIVDPVASAALNLSCVSCSDLGLIWS